MLGGSHQREFWQVRQLFEGLIEAAVLLHQLRKKKFDDFKHISNEFVFSGKFSLLIIFSTHFQS